jgi:hypothetical protein
VHETYYCYRKKGKWRNVDSCIIFCLLKIYVLQILNLASNKSEIERKVHHAIGNYAERGLRSLAVAYQVLVCYSMLVHVQNKT